MAEKDCLVIGAGFGGLATALTLCEGGASVVLCERLRYPGGCASTFTRAGHTFEAGATLFSGFDPGQLFSLWIQRHQLPVTLLALDPVVELRAPDLTLPIPGTRAPLVDRLCALPGAPTEGLRAFFTRQRAVADTLWPLLDDPQLLPPFGLGGLGRHLYRAPRYASLAPLIGRPLIHLLRRHGVADFFPLRLFVDAVCQITVQVPSTEAEAPLALAALDYFFRGTRHIHGGIGELAWALVRAIQTQGGDARLADPVQRLEPTAHGWRAYTRRGAIEARTVVANLLPQGLQALLGDAAAPAGRRLQALGRQVEAGWGAAMLYLSLPRDAPLRPAPHHLQLIHDPARPLQEGNHLFCSVSGQDESRGSAGERSVTISTHVPMATLAALDPAAQGAYIAQVQDTMRATLAARAPELWAAKCHELTASPRTFERFTGRHRGYVGGIPRRAGWSAYRHLGAPELLPGLYLIGDSVFPGQSTLATAVGGSKLARRLLGR
jgi:phytoene dehydrogenase-like protein